MRVLQVHNFYRSSAPSGEDEVVRAERKLLADHGVEVTVFERHNDSLADGPLGSLNAAASNLWSRGARRELANLIRRHRPEIAHFHNTFPQISVSGYAACKSQGVPIVQTLHNFRMFCANGLMLRDGDPCDECLGKFPWPALRHACYRGSRIATAGMSLSIAAHGILRTHLAYVGQFIALTEFAASKFRSAGIPAERITLRGNALATDPGVGDGAGGYALYVGRLTSEKGVATLIEAWKKHAPAKLLVVGDGELRESLAREAKGESIEFLGRRPVEDVLQLMRGAALLVIPSECFEGFPRVFIEAMATGTPVLASRIGGLAELLEDGTTGATFTARDAHDLARMARALFADQARLARMRRAARIRYEADHSPRAAFVSLLKIYLSITRLAGPTSPSAMPARAMPRQLPSRQLPR